MAREADKEPDTVLEVLKKGYKMNGILVRPASVIISKEPQSKANNGPEEKNEAQNGKENKNDK